MASNPAGATDIPVSPPLATPEAWDWPLDGDDDIDEEHGEPAAGTPEGTPLSEGVVDEPTEISKTNSTEAEIDPCSLITTNDWFEYAEELPAAAQLEDGEACGWQSDDDDLRLALGIFRAASVGHYLGDVDRATGTAVDGLGDRATWVEQWPIPQSSTLVIETGPFDVVLEVSARGETWPARMQEVATHFAELVMARFPS